MCFTGVCNVFQKTGVGLLLNRSFKNFNYHIENPFLLSINVPEKNACLIDRSLCFLSRVNHPIKIEVRPIRLTTN